MAASNTPIFIATPRHAMAEVVTANANRNGAGTIATVFTAGSNGSMIEKVYCKARVTTTAGMLRLYISDGTNHYLIDELTIEAVTASGTVPTWGEPWTPPGGALMLPNGYSLRASIVNAESTIVHAIGGDF